MIQDTEKQDDVECPDSVLREVLDWTKDILDRRKQYLAHELEI
jgi:hypothetical protein